MHFQNTVLGNGFPGTVVETFGCDKELHTHGFSTRVWEFDGLDLMEPVVLPADDKMVSAITTQVPPLCYQAAFC